jgi:hypothetical protein
MKNAALQLYTDEGYHALVSNSLAEQIAAFYGMFDRPVMPQRIIRLQALLERTPDRHKSLAWFLAGFVSETIIAKDLLDICRDALVDGVQEMLRDHLADEARHSRYFCEVFHYLWLHLNSAQRMFCASLLPELIRVFFEVDERWLKSSLRFVGLSETACLEIIEGLSDAQATLQRARSGASATLGALEKAGFFDRPCNRKLFTRAGFLDE